MKINKGFKRLRGQYNLEKFCPNGMLEEKWQNSAQATMPRALEHA